VCSKIISEGFYSCIKRVSNINAIENGELMFKSAEIGLISGISSGAMLSIQ